MILSQRDCHYLIGGLAADEYFVHCVVQARNTSDCLGHVVPHVNPVLFYREPIDGQVKLAIDYIRACLSVDAQVQRINH